MQVGKTTAADHLVANHGFAKHAFADPIKRIAAGSFGWDGAKDPRGRRLLQEIGTAGRHYDPDLWLEHLGRRLAGERLPRVVVDDVRLAREVSYLEELGFVCVRILRSTAPVSIGTSDPERLYHETETELDDVPFAHTIANDGSLAELYEAVDELFVRSAGMARSRAN